MRLINTLTLQLEEFVGEERPPYAILSHTWKAQELSLQAFQRHEALDSAGYSKIKRFCSIAEQDGFLYAWADTCCIDKTSSAEMSEAINSMYKWYQAADVCYAYWEDLSMVDHKRLEAKEPESILLDKPRKSMDSRWFSRGWTLQELLAPSSVIFYDQDWVEIGTRLSLKSEITKATKISTTHLTSPHQASIAQRMSWASARTTTRVEDTAYCRLGLFDVNIPLLYGEGDRAFARLQEEVIRTSDDESIFAWCLPSWSNKLFPPAFTGILAESPACFEASGTIISVPRLSGESATLTDRGLTMDCITWSQTNKPLMDEMVYDVRSPLDKTGLDYRLPIAWNTFSRCSFSNQTSTFAVLACAPTHASGDRVILYLHNPGNNKLALKRVKYDCLSIMRQTAVVNLSGSLSVRKLLTSRQTARPSGIPQSYARDLTVLKIKSAKLSALHFELAPDLGYGEWIVLSESNSETVILRRTDNDVQVRWEQNFPGWQLSLTWFGRFSRGLVTPQVALRISNRKGVDPCTFTLKEDGESAMVLLENMDGFQVTLKSGLAPNKKSRCLIVDINPAWRWLATIPRTDHTATYIATQVKPQFQAPQSIEPSTYPLHESFFGMPPLFEHTRKSSCSHIK